MEAFCKIWPCQDPIHAVGPLIVGLIIAYLFVVYLLKYRKPNKP